MGLDCYSLVDQLLRHYEDKLTQAQAQEADAREATRSVATAAEKREDARTTLEYGSLATGQVKRVRRIRAEMNHLERFRRAPQPRFTPKSAIGLGAIVDLSTEDDEGAAERSFVVLPVGAGTELSGPGGDGLISVLTPASPIGKALMGKRKGEGVDVLIRGTWRSWTVEYVA